MASTLRVSNPEHVAVLTSGVKAWNEWRRQTNPQPDLAGADLEDLNLAGVDFCGTDLRGASMRRANLSGANLTYAVLTGSLLTHAYAHGARADNAAFIGTLAANADFQGASMRSARFVDCSFARASLKNVDLTKAWFENADLRHANLQGAVLRQIVGDGLDITDAKIEATIFADTSLRRTIGLRSLRHVGPSSVGMETFFLSGGLPDVFLRGVGMPDDFITYAASLSGKAIDFYSCFISYSSGDDAFATRLYDSLQGRHIRTWFAPEDMKTGDRMRDTIDRSIRLHDKLLLVLSERSIASHWVEHEVESALEREREEERELLFPVRIDDSVFQTEEGWAGLIRRTRHIGDFRFWKDHDHFETAFDRLVRDLRKNAVVMGDT